MSDITLRQLRNTNFSVFYETFLFSAEMTNEDIEKILKLAIIFINAGNELVQELGYRMIIKYTNFFQDYIPLYDIAINKGYIPITKFIENNLLDNKIIKNKFIHEYISSFEENFREDNVYLTEEQFELKSFFIDNNSSSLAVIAPTSYGKSELIMSCIEQNPKAQICILVPTKSLLAQTKRRIKNIKSYDNKRKIITHPEMYSEDDNNFVAVLTQERVLRLMQKNPKVKFDIVIVDEAHNLLDNEERSRLLASALIIINHRNIHVRNKFLTPFLLNTDNLKLNFTNYQLVNYTVEENIKTENYYVYDFYDKPQLMLYDQFLNSTYVVEEVNYKTDIELIENKAESKNIIYLNKPKNIEDFCKRLIHVSKIIKDNVIERAIKDISEYIHQDYLLIDCLKHGFVYHHGSVPDNIRLYIEHLFAIVPQLKYVVTSSTLLEGVNVPADSIFLLETKKGQSNLSHAQFKNLIGRICRFGDIFNSHNENLRKLEPNVYLIKSNYMHSRANIIDFLKKTVRVDKDYLETVDNVLLINSNITEDNADEYNMAKEFIENQQPGITSSKNIKYALTEIGEVCFKNNIIEFDIISNEHILQKKIDRIREKKFVISKYEHVIKIIAYVFIKAINNNSKYKNLKRLEEKEAQNFYTMFLGWKIRQASYNEMIGSFLRHWDKLITEGKDTLVYVDKWGDEIRINENNEHSGYRELWTYIDTKSRRERINLAIVRIKEEQDFLDNYLMKYIEALYDMGFIEDSLYFSIKYGTSDETIITMIKNGLGLQTSKLILNKYRKFIHIDNTSNIMDIDNSIVNEMKINDENEIIIYEISYHIKN